MVRKNLQVAESEMAKQQKKPTSEHVPPAAAGQRDSVCEREKGQILLITAIARPTIFIVCIVYFIMYSRKSII